MTNHRSDSSLFFNIYLINVKELVIMSGISKYFVNVDITFIFDRIAQSPISCYETPELFLNLNDVMVKHIKASFIPVFVLHCHFSPLYKIWAIPNGDTDISLR